MIPKAHKVAFALVLVSMLMFYAMYYYAYYITDEAYIFSKTFTKIISVFSLSPKATEPVWGQPGFFIDENKAIAILFSLSVLLSFLALLIVCIHRVRYGVSQFFIHLFLLSLVSMWCITYVGYQLGLAAYV